MFSFGLAATIVCRKLANPAYEVYHACAFNCRCFFDGFVVPATVLKNLDAITVEGINFLGFASAACLHVCFVL